MKNQLNINEEVKKTLNLIEGNETLEPNPFLFTRIKSKINSGQYSGNIKFLSSGFRIFSVVLFTALFCFNVYSFVIFLQGSNNTTDRREDYLDSLRTEYSSSHSYYNITTISNKE